jgi:hypothetical protein
MRAATEANKGKLPIDAHARVCGLLQYLNQRHDLMLTGLFGVFEKRVSAFNLFATGAFYQRLYRFKMLFFKLGMWPHAGRIGQVAVKVVLARGLVVTPRAINPVFGFITEGYSAVR